MGPLDPQMMKDLRDRDELGARFEGYARGGLLKDLDDQVLRPIFNDAYEEFLKLDPADAPKVARAQARGQFVEQFKKEIQTIIQSGQVARQNLKDLQDDSTHEHGGAQ
jgi:hypothetical protein